MEIAEKFPPAIRMTPGNLICPGPSLHTAENRTRGLYLRAMFSKARSSIPFLIFLVILSAGAYCLFTRLLVSRVEVVGISMFPTLKAGESYLVKKGIFGNRSYQRGEIVVCQLTNDKDLIVKRIIGLPTETVEFRDGLVFVNGQKLSEPYLPGRTPTFLPTTKGSVYVLAEGQYIVLGDNRGVSEDSRVFGAVKKDEILGAVFSYNSLAQISRK